MRAQSVLTLAAIIGLLVSGGPAGAADVKVSVVALSSPSSSDTRQSLPTSISATPVGQDYYVEVWASDVGTTNTGLTSVYVDLTFSPSAATTAKSVSHGGIFTVFPSGTIGSGIVDELGGSSLTAAGIEPQWARAASVRMSANTAGSVVYGLAAGTAGIAAMGRGLIPWSEVQSAGVTVQQVQPPAITVHPVSQTVCAGSSVTFTVSATGTAPLSYQWRKNGVNISGATSASYTITSAATGDAGSYTCVVSNSGGSATSNAATLTVNTPPVITAHPVGQAVCEGSSVTFSVTATGGGPFTYQWRKNGSAITGATSSNYTINPVGLAHAGSYDCVVTNNCGSTTSNAAVLTVNTAPSITQHPAGQDVCDGGSAAFTVVATGTAPLSYQWRKDGFNIPGATSAGYTINPVGPPSAGSYDCVVSNICGSATSNAAVLTIRSAPVITGYPRNQTVCAGAPVTFTITATGSAPLSYQWRKNTANIPGATTSSYTIAAAAASDAGDYDCVVSNPCGSVTSNIAALIVNAPPVITGHPVSQTACAGDTVVLTVAANGTAPLTYQWRKNGVNLPGATGPSYIIASATASDAGSYSCVVTNGCGSAASNTAVLTVNAPPLITDDPDSRICCEGDSVTFTVSATGSGPLIYQWRHNGIDIPGAMTAGYTIACVQPSDAGNYHCVVSNPCGSTTSAAAVLSVGMAPVIGYSPEDRAVCEGDSVTFTVFATGTPPFTYQWRKNGNPIPGATGSSLTIHPTARGDAGYYECMVTNGCGSSVSGAAALTINTAPVIAQNPASQTVDMGGSATLTVAATGPGVLSYQWRKDQQNIPGATGSSYTISDAGADDAGSYECVVANCCGLVVSDTVVLTVAGAVIYVDASASGSGTGVSWEDAFNYLQDALDAAALSGQATEIRVAAGVYRPDRGIGRTMGDRTQTFALSSHLSLMGGYAGASGPDPDLREVHLYETVLCGDIGTPGNALDNSLHVVKAVGISGAVLDGFTIQAGNADTGLRDGAGLYIADSTLTVVRCVLRDNTADSGAALANIDGAVVIQNCIFADNHASVSGGGIFNDDAGSPTIVNCTFSGNTAGIAGGGIYSLSGHAAISNSIFWDNREAGEAGQSAQIHIAGGDATVDYCCIQGLTGSLGGLGNIGEDPGFVDAAAGDYHLKSQGWRWNRTTRTWESDSDTTSRCIDAGNPGSSLLDEPMPDDVGSSDPDTTLNVRVNMGAYGGTPRASLAPSGWALLPDADNGGTVDFADLAVAISCWSATGSDRPFDFNRSGMVNFADLRIFAEHWLDRTTRPAP